MRTRSGWMAVWTAALVGCGGGAVALLPFVGAIGGFWQTSVDANGAFVPDGNASLDFDGTTDYYATQPNTRAATLNTASLQCGVANFLDVSIVLNGEQLTISVPDAPGVPGRPNCMTGRFLDEQTLRLDTGGSGTLLRNQLGFDPVLSTGVWVNLDNEQQQLVFRTPQTDTAGLIVQTGCEYQGAARVGELTISYRRADPASGARTQIESLILTRTSAGSITWVNGHFRGASALEFDSAGGVKLQRRDRALDCP